jgi:hypothetical protein
MSLDFTSNHPSLISFLTGSTCSLFDHQHTKYGSTENTLGQALHPWFSQLIKIAHAIFRHQDS